jgi:hypothetical protein
MVAGVPELSSVLIRTTEGSALQGVVERSPYKK